MTSILAKIRDFARMVSHSVSAHLRTISAAISGFGPEEQERILRWVREKAGLAPTGRSGPEMRSQQSPSSAVPAKPAESVDTTREPTSTKDLKSFVAMKKPKSDAQFAATVAYFYRFEAPPDRRKNEIDAATLQDACRLAGRKRLQHPSMTLNNAKNVGLIDRGSESGRYTINTVGENLVAMTLPDQGAASVKNKKSKKSPRKKK